MPTPPLPAIVQADSMGTPFSSSASSLNTATTARSATATIAASTASPASSPFSPPSSSLGLVSTSLPATAATHASSSSPAFPVTVTAFPSSRSSQLLDRLVQAANRATAQVGTFSPQEPHPDRPPLTEVEPLRLQSTPASISIASSLANGSFASVSTVDRPLPPLPPRNVDDILSPPLAEAEAEIQAQTRTEWPDLRPCLDLDDPFPDTASDLPEISILSLGEGQDDGATECEKALPQAPQPTTARLSIQGSLSASSGLSYLADPASSAASGSMGNSVSSSRAPSPYSAPTLSPSGTEPMRSSLTPQSQPLQQGYPASQAAVALPLPPDVVVAPPSPVPYVMDQPYPYSTALQPSPVPLPMCASAPPSLSFTNTGYDLLPSPALTDQQDSQQQQDRPPSYIAQAGNRGSMIIAQAPTEDQMFEVSVLSQPLPYESSLFSPTGIIASSSSSSASSLTPHQFISAAPMHDQQYLLLGCANALHSIDLTLPAHQRQVRTHIQGVSFKEIHCLEDIGLVVVIAGRNNRVRCYDYESMKKLVEYGHSKEGRGRVVEGGRLGPVKHKIQLRVETALLSSNAREGGAVPSGGPSSSPLGKTSRFVQRPSHYPGPPPLPARQQQQTPPLPTMITTTATNDTAAHRGAYMPGHRHTTSLDRNLLSPLDIESPVTNEAQAKPKKARPLSFGALASLAQEHGLRGKSSKDNQQQSAPNNANGGTSLLHGGQEQSSNNGAKSKRFAQVASYLGHTAAQDRRPSDEAMDWAWDFVKLRQTKDVMALDFHYTATTVFMTVLSKSGIDIFSRPKSARGNARPAFRVSSRSSSREGSEGGEGICGGSTPSAATSAMTGAAGAPTASASGAQADHSSNGHRIGGGMATVSSNTPGLPFSASAILDVHRTKSERNPHDWQPFKQFYHPEPPSFMTVVKNMYAVTDIILGKGQRACVINVEDMTVKELYHPEPTPSTLHGLGKKFGFRSGGSMWSSSSTQLWHSFEKIPYDVPASVLYPATVDALYGNLSASGGGSRHQQERRRSLGGAVVDSAPIYQQHPAFTMRSVSPMYQQQQQKPSHYNEQDATSSSSGSSSSSSTPSSNSPSWQPQHQHSQQQHQQNLWAQGPSHASPLPPLTSATTVTSAPSATRKARMVTSDQVLNLAFSRPTTNQLFLATHGTQSRIVDLGGKPVSGIVIDWGQHVPQKVEFLRTAYDIYVVGFERTRIMIYSLTRAVKVKEIARQGSTWSFENQQQQQQQHRQQQHHQEQQQQLSVALQGSEGQPRPPDAHGLGGSGGGGSTTQQHHAMTTSTSSSVSMPSSPSHYPTNGNIHGYGHHHTGNQPHYPLLPSAMGATTHSSGVSTFKFLARDIDDDSFFFSHGHAKHGMTVCKLGLFQFEQDDFEIHGWY